MTVRPAPARRRPDPLTSPADTPLEIAMDHAIAPFDRACREADRKWGIDRLPELVSTDLAARYGRAVAALNTALEAQDAAGVAATAQNCIKGLVALDQAAEAAGAPKADPQVWEYDLDGWRFGVLRDDREWPALKEQRPDLQFFTMREVAQALKAYRLDSAGMKALRDVIPEARVKAIRTKPPVDWKNGGDSLEGVL